MRILVIAPDTEQLRPFSNSIFNEMKNFGGAEIEMVAMNIFYLNCSYFQRRLYKLGYRADEIAYDKKIIDELEKRCAEFKPDCVLILNGTHVPTAVQKFLTRYKIIAWLWDSFRRGPGLISTVNLADEIFCFEYEDLKFLAEKGKLAHYLPLGADDKIYFPREVERDIDISFVGLASKERLELLNKICERALQKNWNVKIGGIFYDKKHFWKKYIFRYRQEYLAKFIDNRIFSSKEVAELYCRSKICLNINTKIHHSLSPRTFEICATKSFQLMNSGQNSHGLMNLETDLATFDGAEDLLEKIEFYLANDELREKIALAGYDSVIKNCTMKKSVEKLFAESEILRGLK